MVLSKVKQSIIFRSIFYNVILIIVVTIATQLLYYSYVEKSFKDEINKYNIQIVEQIRQTIDENILDDVIALSKVYFTPLHSNKDLTYPMKHDIRKDTMRIVNISNRISDILGSNNILEGLDVFYPQSNILFTNSSVHLLDDVVQETYLPDWFELIDKKDLKSVWLPTRYIGGNFNYSICSYIRTIPLFGGSNNRQAVIAAHINVESLKHYVVNKINDDGNMFLILDEENNIIMRKGDNIDQIKDKVINSDIYKKNDGIVELNQDNFKGMITYSKSKSNGWTYILVSNKAFFYKESYQMKQILLMVGVLILIISVCIVIVVTIRYHKPLRNVLSTIKENLPEQGDLNEDNEYNLLMNTFNGLTIQVDQLHQQITENKPIIRHTVLTNLVNGEGGIILDKNERNKLNLVEKNVFCFIIKIATNKEMSYDSKVIIDYKLIQLLETNITSFKLSVITNESNTLIGIANFSDTLSRGDCLKQIEEVIKSALMINYSIFIGNNYMLNANNIAKSFQEATTSKKYAFLMPEMKIIKYNELHVDSRKDKGSAHKILVKVQDAIRSGKEKELKYSIDSIVISLGMEQYKLEYAKNALLDIVSTMSNTMSEMNFSLNELMGYNVREKCKKIDNINEFEIWINEVISVLTNAVNSKRDNKNVELHAKLKKIIDENIYNELSLESVAERMHMRADSLSKLFKEVMGVTFTSYIKQVKLQNATELLKENELSIGEISSKLGYNSTQYFIRIFKSKYAITPKQYQINYLRKLDNDIKKD
ncbi:MAG: AraC family transcriptional regulator [Vallitalea sp.]|jgi:AraC-like DNA-binding protein|nr:AraC family transcriptional regulator [Vallitalea sp.]